MRARFLIKSKGDVHLNGKIDLEDAVYAPKIALGILRPIAEDEMCADIDENGKVDTGGYA